MVYQSGVDIMVYCWLCLMLMATVFGLKLNGPFWGVNGRVLNYHIMGELPMVALR